ncbi:hypothetical protein [Sneathiella aquimaris]|uniref:hypothetical protein n=1 Tax=Sneathiella aquimaris TaxID=2599305 RepID=UPI00146B552F|nr:hypothetical protein [Sneathiella aquimaris]
MKKLILGAFVVSALSTTAAAQESPFKTGININTVDITSPSPIQDPRLASTLTERMDSAGNIGNNFNNMQINFGHSISQLAYISIPLGEFTDSEKENTDGGVPELPKGFSLTSVSYGNSGPIIDFMDAVTITPSYSTETTTVELNIPKLW